MAKSKKPQGQRSATSNDEDFGRRLRLRRLEMKLSQADLGAKLGISFQQVQKYEKGRNRIGAARLQQIATALDVPVSFFYETDKSDRKVDSLLFLDSAFGLRMLKAWNSIQDEVIRRSMVVHMETIAEQTNR